MKLKLTILLLSWATITFSQINSAVSSGIIKGVVIEEATGKPLPAVNILVAGTKSGTVSDGDGTFIFRNLASGKYNLQFSTMGFDTKIVTEIEVTKNEALNISVSMVEQKNLLDEVVIRTTKMKTESIKSLLTMQKNSIRVSDGISAESIKKTPDKTTSDVLKRISGASIQDNKFVIIRGLNDRYNLTFLNGGPLPSSEPDRKAFSFDIFPSNMIDNLIINKTASPDLPGEFAGGIIEINTKAIPDKNFQSISFGYGINTISTGKKQLYAKRGSKDWLGYDDGTRSLPSSFPSVSEFQDLQDKHLESDILKIDALTKSIDYDWALKTKKFQPNTNFQFTLGRHFDLKNEKSFGFIMSLSNSTSNNYNQTIRKTYDSFENAPSELRRNLTDDRFSEATLSGAIANFAVKLNQNNTISFKNLYSITSNNKVLDRRGDLTQDSDPQQIHTTARSFTNNTIYTGQLIGEHFLPESKIKINWVGSYGEVERYTPNDRRNTYFYTKFDDGTFSQPTATFKVNTTGSESPGSMYSSKNNEQIYSGKLDVNKKIKLSEETSVDVKTGFFTQLRNRVFNAREIGYIPFNGFVNGVNYGTIPRTFDGRIAALDDANMFNVANMGILGTRKSGLTLYDGTKQTDSYNASSRLNAAYLMLDNTFNKFRIIWGVRIEDYSQELHSKEDNGTPIDVNRAKTDFLPSLNIIYGLNSKQNLRFSASKTLNRPEFRELAPFVFYDADTGLNTEGNPNLKTATIINGDLRYEIFPGKGQLFSISAFYKHFDNPIELQALANNSNKYQNSKTGTNKGIEIEYRTMLSSIFKTFETSFLDDITIFTNLAVIRSRVDMTNLVKTSGATEIPLQGQSPYVFNAGILYINKDNGWSASANLNKIGDRVAFHGNLTDGSTTPSLWEKSRTFLDMQISKSFMKNKLEIKLNAQNILAQNLVFYQNNYLNNEKITGVNSIVNSIFAGDSQNKNGYRSSVDDRVWITKFGQSFSLTFSYNF